MIDLRWFSPLSPARERTAPLRRVASPLAGAQLWLIDLDVELRQHASECLDDAERQRAERFRVDSDRMRYVAGRVWMRHLLARASACAVGDLALRKATNGKPALFGPDPELTFNFSRSGGHALLAIGRDVPLGVDLERIDRVQDLDRLARLNLDASEHETWSELSPAARERGFLRAWTRKEACLKAWGVVGLSLDPQRLHVGLSTGREIVPPPEDSCDGEVTVASVVLPEQVNCEAALAMGPPPHRRRLTWQAADAHEVAVACRAGVEEPLRGGLCGPALQGEGG